MEDREVEDIVAIAKKRYKLSSEYCQPFFDRFMDNYEHYFLRIIDKAVEADPEAYPFYSQVSIPISFQVVETVITRMFNRMMDFNIRTEDDNDEQDEAALRELIKYQLNHPYLEDDPIFARTATAAKEMFITGNAWGMVPWMKKEVEVEEYLPYSPEMGLPPSWDNLEIMKQYGIEPRWMMVPVKKKLIDAPVFEHVSLFHVFPDPKKKRVSQLGYAIVEDMLTKDEILQMAAVDEKSFKNMDKFKKMEPNASPIGQANMNYDEQIASMFGSKDYSDKDQQDGQYKVWYMMEPDRYSIIINEQLCIRDGKNPNGDGKLGLFLMKDIPVPHQLYAWGEIDPIKRLEDSMTDQFNMRNDSVMYDLLRMWKVDPTAMLDGESFVPEPGTVVEMTPNGMDGIQPLDTGSTPPTAYREYDEWDQIIQSTSGVTDYATGSSAPGMNKTASGVENLQAAANARFAFKLQLFESLGLKAMGSMYVKRNLRYFDSPQRVLSDDGTKRLVTPEQVRRIRGNVHFIVDTGSTEAVNMNTERQKWEFVIEAIGANKPPFDNLAEESKMKAGKKMLSALKINNPDELLIKAPPLPPQPPVPLNPAGAIDPANVQQIQADPLGPPQIPQAI